MQLFLPFSASFLFLVLVLLLLRPFVSSWSCFFVVVFFSNCSCPCSSRNHLLLLIDNRHISWISSWVCFDFLCLFLCCSCYLFVCFPFFRSFLLLRLFLLLGGGGVLPPPRLAIGDIFVTHSDKRRAKSRGRKSKR